MLHRSYDQDSRLAIARAARSLPPSLPALPTLSLPRNRSSPVMISFRKCLVIAACFIAFIFVLHSTHSTSQAAIPKDKAQKQDKDAASSPPPSPLSQNDQKPRKPSSIEDLADKPLRERLRFQFPYNVNSKFPAYIWQTWKYTPDSGKFGENLRPMEATWTEHHPGFIHQVLGDQDARYLIRYLYASFPEILEAYDSMPKAVLRADYFRYLILLARGGIYTDIDTYVLKPATDWLPPGFDRSTIGLIIGIEADPDRPDWAEWYSRRIQFCQWTIQSKPGHPALRDLVAVITDEALRMKRSGILTKSKMDKSIVEFTGPAVWTDAVFRYFNNPSYFDIGNGGGGAKNISALDFTGITKQKRVGDVVVLPITSFSPGVQQMGAEEPDHEMAFVKHEFSGTWKPRKERNMGH